MLELGSNVSRLLVEVAVDRELPSEMVITHLMQFSNLSEASRKQENADKNKRKQSVDKEVDGDGTVYYNAVESQ